MVSHIFCMGYRTGLEIKKTILDQLADRPRVLSELERRVDTNDRVLKRHLEELAYLGVVQLITHPRHAKTGRPYTTAKLTSLLLPSSDFSEHPYATDSLTEVPR